LNETKKKERKIDFLVFYGRFLPIAIMAMPTMTIAAMIAPVASVKQA
jgi:hypothetical protein